MTLDTPEAIRMYRLITIRKGLEMEIQTGMRHSRNMILNAAKAETGKKTRKACLDAIIKMIESETVK